MTNVEAILDALTSGGVDYIVVGGVAGIAHGASRLTQDLDIVYARDDGNLERLASSLSSFEPYLRGAPRGLPFKLDAATLKRGLNFTLTTTLGDLDLLGEIAGGGTYSALVPHSVELPMPGGRCRCIDLQTLIRVKRAAGRPKDIEAIAELEEILEAANAHPLPREAND